jgi:hypothetical protein
MVITFILILFYDKTLFPWMRIYSHLRLTPWSRIVLDSLSSRKASREILNLHGTRWITAVFIKKIATGPYCEPNESCPQTPNIFFTKIYFNIIHQSMAGLFKVGQVSRFSDKNFVCICHLCVLRSSPIASVFVG